MSESPTFSAGRCKSQTSTTHVNLHACEPCGTSCQQVEQSQDGSEVCSTLQEGNTFCSRTTAVNRRHTVDGTVTSGSSHGPGDSEGFHAYLRQPSDGPVSAEGGLQHCSSPFSRLQEVFSPDSCSPTHRSSCEVPTSWEQYNNSIQRSYSDAPDVPVEPSGFLSQSYPSYSSSPPLQQGSSRLQLSNDHSNSVKYSLESLSMLSHQSCPTQSLFPKPIYSYSILIFMALKNSKTRSLPVSEIYSFMTEHFPYFKTAPDGWKNSVRHNLSLNKCFEKVENKNGNSSRKGCLWALNPAKVEKMQEEMHKWRRKDPLTVRRSMARPEDLDHLLGERPNKFRSLPTYNNAALITRVAHKYGSTSTSCAPTLLRSPTRPSRHPQYMHIPAASQQFCFLSPTATHTSNSFAPYSPCGQQPTAGVPSATGSLNSPMAGRMPQADTLQTESSVGPRSMQDLLLEGDASYDVDTLNPSLIDLQLQGNLWEELREDSLTIDSQVVTTSSPSTTSTLQDPRAHAGFVQASLPLSPTSEGAVIGWCKADYGDTGRGQSLEQHGWNPGVYSGVDNLTGYLTYCTTSISLI